MFSNITLLIHTIDEIKNMKKFQRHKAKKLTHLQFNIWNNIEAFKLIYWCVDMCTCRHNYDIILREVRRPARVNSLLPSYGLQGPNSGCQVWWQVSCPLSQADSPSSRALRYVIVFEISNFLMQSPTTINFFSGNFQWMPQVRVCVFSFSFDSKNCFVSWFLERLGHYSNCVASSPWVCAF